jgi:regulator of RNase E activity RraA
MPGMFRIATFFLTAVAVFAQEGVPPHVWGKLAAQDKTLFGKLAQLELEALWSVVAEAGYTNCFINELQPIHTDRRLIGRARTIRYLPNRPDLRERLYAKGPQLNYVSSDNAEPGDVLVFDAGGDVRSAVTGAMTTRRLVARGGAGMIADGAFRDVGQMRELPIQVYMRRGQASSVSPNLMSVDYQAPVRIGNVTVAPGDILVGEEHGVLVIPVAVLDKAIAKAGETVEREKFQQKLLEQGEAISGVYPRLNEANQKRFEAERKKAAGKK